MGETRVDLLHLLEDLRDAYPGALEETILTEIVANCLDSGASLVEFGCDPSSTSLAVVDNGSGMKRRDLARYHDIAASTKTRGQGIGFAGVGIKLALLQCEEVVTETRRGRTHLATRWRLGSRYKAPWKWEPPPGLVPARGTAVRMRLNNPLSPLLDPGFIEDVVLHHYRPLFEPHFVPILSERYPHAVRFAINDRELSTPASEAAEMAPIQVRMPRRRKPSATGYLIRASRALPEGERGVAISTLGKVIKRGWDWLGITPANPDHIGGIVEAPGLAECLTLNKADFIRSGTRGAAYLAYRKAIQEVVSHQLEAWGDARGVEDASRRRAARPVERDLERVLVDLADAFPLVAALVHRREGGQRKLPMGSAGNGRHLVAAAVKEMAGRVEEEGMAAPSGSREAPPIAAGREEDVAREPEPAGTLPAQMRVALPGAKGPTRPARYGLEIQFERREGVSELGRLVESTVWVNEAHPAYTRAVASRSEGYHIALSVAMAIAPLAVEPNQERAFLTAFLARWGSVLRQKRGSGAP